MPLARKLPRPVRGTQHQRCAHFEDSKRCLRIEWLLLPLRRCQMHAHTNGLLRSLAEQESARVRNNALYNTDLPAQEQSSTVRVWLRTGRELPASQDLPSKSRGEPARHGDFGYRRDNGKTARSKVSVSAVVSAEALNHG